MWKRDPCHHMTSPGAGHRHAPCPDQGQSPVPDLNVDGVLNSDSGHAHALGFDLAHRDYGEHRYTGPDADGDPADLVV